MEGKKFLEMDREMRTAVGLSYVILLAILIAVFAMFNSKVNQNEAALKARLKASEASVKASEASLKASVKASEAALEARLKASAARLKASAARLKASETMNSRCEPEGPQRESEGYRGYRGADRGEWRGA